MWSIDKEKTGNNPTTILYLPRLLFFQSTFKTMATVRFQLRKPSAADPQPIYLVFRFKNERMVYSCGAKVHPKFWNEEKQRVKTTTNVPDRDAINAMLSDLEAAANSFYHDASARRSFSLPGLKSHLENFQGRAVAMVPQTFFAFFRQFIETSRTRTQTETGERIHPRTVAKYASTLKLIEAFAKAHPRRAVDFQTIDLEFYQDFTEYLQNRPHSKGAGYSVNAIGKHIQILKTVLNEATEQGANHNKAYKSPKFKVLKEESDNVYLTETELETIYHFDFSGNARLDRVRDLFLVGCWTGLRFSDLSTLNPDKHLNGDTIEIEQYKTGGRVVIPVHPTVRAILDKYENRLPATISNQKFNDYLKEVCRLAGISERVQKGITKAGLRVVTHFDKWQMVSTHTARRSFATNLYMMGVPSITIMQITGHKTEKAFLKYIKASPQEHAKILKLHWQKRHEGKTGKIVNL